MPFRCTTCQQLSKDPTPVDCTNPSTSCNFQRVEVIHYASVQGLGRAVGTLTIVEGEDQKKVLHSINLHCQSKVESPQFTPMKDAVTCLSCIDAFPPAPIETEKE